MRFCLIPVALSVGLLITGSLRAEDAPPGVAARITLVSSSDAPGRITRDHLAHVYWELIRGQKLENKTLPKIVVLHVSQQEAANASLVQSQVNADNLGDYQLWLVGKPSADMYVRGMETILRHAFQLPKKDPPEFLSLMRRLIEFESATVDVQSLVSK